MGIFEFIKKYFRKKEVVEIESKYTYEESKYNQASEFADSLYYKLLNTQPKGEYKSSFFAYAGGEVYIYFSYVEEEEDDELCSLFYLCETGEYTSVYEMTDSMLNEFKDYSKWYIVSKEPVIKDRKLPWQFTTNKGK